MGSPVFIEIRRFHIKVQTLEKRSTKKVSIDIMAVFDFPVARKDEGKDGYLSNIEGRQLLAYHTKGSISPTPRMNVLFRRLHQHTR